MKYLRPAIVAVLALGAVATPASASPGATERLSVDSAGVQGNGFSFLGDMSADGRFVAFDSEASNLVVGDGQASGGAFVRDRQTGSTERVSISTTGDAAGGNNPAISADGRFVAFESGADNLVPDDANLAPDVFVRDRQAGTTERVSISTAGDEGDGASFFPDISGDGRYIVFQSEAANLVPDDTNGDHDIFVHDRETGVTERVSVDSAGNQADGHSAVPAINGDGRIIVFTTFATNLDDSITTPAVFVHDRQTGLSERVVFAPSDDGAISADGSVVAFRADSSLLPSRYIARKDDVFIRDLETGIIERASVDSAGTEGDSHSGVPVISEDNRFVAFVSAATNLVPGDSNGFNDVFVHDRENGITERVSVDSGGNQANWYSGISVPSISANGRFVAFDSQARNLVPDDTNGYSDVFVHDRSAPTLTPSPTPTEIPTAAPTATPGEFPETGGPSRGGAGDVRLAFAAALLATGGFLIVLGWHARRRWLG